MMLIPCFCEQRRVFGYYHALSPVVALFVDFARNDGFRHIRLLATENVRTILLVHQRNVSSPVLTC